MKHLVVTKLYYIAKQCEIKLSIERKNMKFDVPLNAILKIPSEIQKISHVNPGNPTYEFVT